MRLAKQICDHPRDQREKKHLCFPQKTQKHAEIQHRPNTTTNKKQDKMTENDISYKIRGAIFEVYNSLGPGLLESIYQNALILELKGMGLHVLKEVPLEVLYKGKDLGLGFRFDILVENKVVIEIKSVEHLAEVHHKQLLTYLKLSGLKLGILVNFNEENIVDGIFRKVNQL